MKNYSEKIIYEDKERRVNYFDKKGQYHRTDGPAVEYSNGDREWRIKGLLHRTDGPALEWNKIYKQWYINGKRHREDGPAVERVNGTCKYFIHGIHLSKEEFLYLTKYKENYSYKL